MLTFVENIKKENLIILVIDKKNLGSCDKT